MTGTRASFPAHGQDVGAEEVRVHYLYSQAL